jgi:ribosomal protein L7/L12
MTERNPADRLTELERRVSRLEGQIDALLKVTQVEPPPLEPHAAILAQVKSLAAENRILEAIDLYRQHTGIGMAEAKAYVEALPRPAP